MSNLIQENKPLSLALCFAEYAFGAKGWNYFFKKIQKMSNFLQTFPPFVASLLTTNEHENVPKANIMYAH